MYNDVPDKVDNNAKILSEIYEKPIDKKAFWNDRTTLIIGDSMLFGIDEGRLKYTKVRIYPGASVDDMFFNIFPLLRKNPTNIILHVGTNNAVTENSTQIMSKLSKLKYFITSILPNCKVVFSQLINRFDDAKAQLTVKETNEKLVNSEVSVIDNNNITREHLGKKGLHMNTHGTGKLAINMIKMLKRL